MMPLCPVSEFYHQAFAGLEERSAEIMLSSVSNSDSRQNAQQAIQEKQQDDARNVHKNQQSRTANAQRTNRAEQEQSQVRAENQNSHQGKGASIDVRA